MDDEACIHVKAWVSGRYVHTSGLWQALFICCTITVHICAAANVCTLSGGVCVQSCAQCFFVFICCNCVSTNMNHANVHICTGTVHA